MKPKAIAEKFAKKIEAVLNELERHDLHFVVSTDGALYICTRDESYDTAGKMLAEIRYSTIPWDEDQIVREAS